MLIDLLIALGFGSIAASELLAGRYRRRRSRARRMQQLSH
jgi:hypothetical protein